MNPKTTLAQRRQFLKSLAVAASATATAPLLTSCTPADFQHGVASGDPLHDSVVIWTRVSPLGIGPSLVRWEVARDANFDHVVRSGKTLTASSVDFTVKVDVTGLRPGKRYFYRFICGTHTSPVGATRTLPRGRVDELSFVVFSCSNYPAGYFHAYREAAARADDIDYALHLGDYIYEYGRNGYASELAEELGREVDPETELLSLSDYRTRYAQYRSDRDLKEVHRLLPFFVVWDDHEISNDTYLGGAENHDPSEGDFDERKAMAIQAYYEWMPLRETETREEIYRSFDFGDLLTLHVLDTRVVGREKQLSYPDYFTAEGTFDEAGFVNDLTDADRTLLGAEQENYLEEALESSGATWQLLGQQVLMAVQKLPAPLVLQQVDLGTYQALVEKARTDPGSLSPEEIALLSAPSIPLNLDAWDGYPAARERLLEGAVRRKKNLISLAGDTHNAWASDLTTLDGTPAGVEFATTSVSSPGFEEFLPQVPPEILAPSLVQFMEDLRWANTEHRGFMTLRVTRRRATATWHFLDTVRSKDYRVLGEATQELSVWVGENRVDTV